MTRRHEVVTRVVEAIAETEGTQPHDLEYSLYNHIETEALLTLMASDYTDWELTFQVPDHTVTVRGNGQILVDDIVRREVDPPSRQTN